MADQATVTIKKIAREAGVSRSAASMALNNYRRSTLSESTRKRIVEVARNMGYVPMSPAGKVQTGRKRIEYCSFGRSPHNLSVYHEFLDGATRASHDEFCDLLISELPRMIEEGQFVKSRLAHDSADGRIVTGSLSPDVIAILRQSKVPVVIIGNYHFPGCPFPVVKADLPGGIRNVIEHLRRGGRRRLALLENAHRTGYLEHEVRSACSEQTQAMGMHFSLHGTSDLHADECVEMLLKSDNPPDAIITDPVKSLAAAKTIARHAPDVTVASFGNSPLLEETRGLDTWTLTFDSTEMARLGVDVLLKMIRGQLPAQGQVFSVDTELFRPAGS